MKTKKSVNLKQILLDFFVSFDIILLIKEDLGKLIKNKFIRNLNIEHFLKVTLQPIGTPNFIFNFIFFEDFFKQIKVFLLDINSRAKIALIKLKVLLFFKLNLKSW